MPPQAAVSWGGVNITAGFTFPFQPIGIQPSVCNIKSPPHSTSLAAQGALTLSYDGGSLVFADCRLARPRLDLNRGGRMWTLPILDRRWKWRFGLINGSYNLRQPDDTLKREQTPQELATLLLDAMGEADYQVASLPNDPRPEVRWQDSNPASELAALCNRLGCEVVFNPYDDRVEIWRSGETSTLPTGFTVGGAVGFSEPAAPDTIRAIAGRTQFQGVFSLEAVGEDVDGEIVPVDELTYKPAAGWGKVDADFMDVGGTYNRDGRTFKTRDLAKASVWRMYRVTGLADGGWSPNLLDGDGLEPQSLDDLQLLPVLAEEHTPSDGVPRPLPARVEGKWTIDDESAESKSSDGVLLTDFALEPRTGVLTFAEQIFLRENDETRSADIRLESSFYAGASGQFHRHAYDHSTGAANGTQPLPLPVSEAQRRVVYRYVEGAVANTEDNESEVDGELQAMAEAKALEYEASDTSTVRYVGFIDVPPDGAIRQIIYSSSKQGAFTTVAVNREAASYVPSLEERRRRQRIEKQTETLLQVDDNRRFEQLVARIA